MHEATVSALPSVPETRRDDDLVEDLHGREVADPYRWLEDLDSDETRAWVAAQNVVTDAHLSAIEVRDHVREVVASLWDHPRHGVPFRRGRRWFQLRNTGLQDQDVLWTALADDTSSVAPADGWEVLLDPNPLSDDGTVSLNGMAVSDDGALLVYGLSEAGSDWRSWHVRDTATGTDTADVVEWAKFTEAAWLPDASGFLYGAFDPPAEGEEFEAANRDQRLMLHRLGTDQSDDVVVYHRPDQPEWSYHPDLSHDGRWLAIVVSHGTETDNRLHVAPIAEDGTIGEIAPLFDREDAMYHPLGAVGDELWFHTDRDAPNGRVVAVDPTAGPEPALREVVPETDDRLEDVRVVGGAGPGDDGWIVCCYVHHASSLIVIRTLDGETVREVPLPGFGTAGNTHTNDRLSGGRTDDAIHLGYEDFTSPVRVLRHDLATGDTVEAHPSGLAADGFETEQVFVPSGDVRVPVFVVRRREVEPDGARPTVLWGYGGFDIPVLPHFRTAFRSWVELGGVLAVACLRGGGEYGKAWHDAGRLGNKQHVFDDAIAVAEWLTGQRGAETADGEAVGDTWTAPDHLGIEGRSNGGLLVGAVMTQRPDLFGSCLPEVGVLDMLRFHRFTIGWAWISDYGDPDDPDDFATLLAYSPLHNLRDGTAYPPTLVTTGDHDDRVVPAHSYKFAAALQRAQGGDAPVLIRIDTSAGHGQGKPVSKLIDERSDVLAFHAHHLGLDPR